MFTWYTALNVNPSLCGARHFQFFKVCWPKFWPYDVALNNAPYSTFQNKNTSFFVVCSRDKKMDQGRPVRNSFSMTVLSCYRRFILLYNTGKYYQRLGKWFIELLRLIICLSVFDFDMVHGLPFLLFPIRKCYNFHSGYNDCFASYNSCSWILWR